MDGTGRLARGAVVVTFALLVGFVLVPRAAWAADPPSVVGLTVAQLEPVLRDWDKSVVISYDPALDQLPPGVDPDRVVAQGATVLPPPVFSEKPSVPPPPRVLVELGALVPDLTGLTRDAATAALAPLGLTADGLPAAAPPAWVTAQQRPKPGTVVGFGRAVLLQLVSDATPTAGVGPGGPPSAGGAPPVGGRRPVLLAAAVTGSGLALVAAALVLVTSVRRSRRRRGRAPERVELHGHPGQVEGPDLVDPPPRPGGQGSGGSGPGRPGPGGSVRLEPRHDPGSSAVVLLEVWP